MFDGNCTAPATGRDSESEIDVDKPFAPDSAWVDEIEKQTTPALIAGLHRYAHVRAYGVAATGRKVDDFYVRELVQDAIVDTWLGVLRWDPERCSLKKHLAGAIKSRTKSHRNHATDNPHEYIGDDTAASRLAEQDASCIAADPEYSVQRIYAQQTLAQIRAAASCDKPVLRILDAYEAGAHTKEEVLAHANMKARTYHNARIRLKRIVSNLADSKLTPKARA
jgi:hypothetical protein